MATIVNVPRDTRFAELGAALDVATENVTNAVLQRQQKEKYKAGMAELALLAREKQGIKPGDITSVFGKHGMLQDQDDLFKAMQLESGFQQMTFEQQIAALNNQTKLDIAEQEEAGRNYRFEEGEKGKARRLAYTESGKNRRLESEQRFERPFKQAAVEQKDAELRLDAAKLDLEAEKMEKDFRKDRAVHPELQYADYIDRKVKEGKITPEVADHFLNKFATQQLEIERQKDLAGSSEGIYVDPNTGVVATGSAIPAVTGNRYDELVAEGQQLQKYIAHFRNTIDLVDKYPSKFGITGAVQKAAQRGVDLLSNIPGVRGVFIKAASEIVEASGVLGEETKENIRGFLDESLSTQQLISRTLGAYTALQRWSAGRGTMRGLPSEVFIRDAMKDADIAGALQGPHAIKARLNLIMSGFEKDYKNLQERLKQLPQEGATPVPSVDLPQLAKADFRGKTESEAPGLAKSLTPGDAFISPDGKMRTWAGDR